MISKLLITTLFIANVSKAWSVPGIVPKNYEKGQMLDILVGPLQTDSAAFSFDWYTLNWCTNKRGRGFNPDTMGETLTGSPLHESPFDHKFGYDRNIVVCKKILTHA